jgi:hypothetical protein
LTTRTSLMTGASWSCECRLAKGGRGGVIAWGLARGGVLATTFKGEGVWGKGLTLLVQQLMVVVPAVWVGSGQGGSWGS